MLYYTRILYTSYYYTIILYWGVWPLTSVITPMRSMSRAGLRGSSLGVECPLGGEEEAKEEAVAEAVMEAPWWCILARLRPSRLTLATRFSISSARSSVDSFSSWMSL